MTSVVLRTCSGLFLGSFSIAGAAVFTWNGASPFLGGNSNWANADNWSGGVAPPNDGSADIVISGNQRFNPTVNVAWTINTLTFSSTAQSFTLGGQTLTLQTDGIVNPVAPLILNSSSLTHFINNSLVFNNDGTINASTGDLTFGGTSINNNGNIITLTAGSGRTLTFDTVLTGTGGFTKSGSGTAIVNTTAIYTGATVINAGTLDLTGSLANSGSITLAGGTLRLLDNERLNNSATLAMSSGSVFNLNGFTETIGTLSGAGTIQLGSNGALTVNQATSQTFSGSISGSGGSFTKLGSGILTLTGSSSYTGATTVNGGTLRLGASDRISNSSSLTVGSGAVFDLATFSETVSSLSGAGTILLSSDVFNPASLTLSGSASTTFSGSVSGIGTVAKTSSGTLTFTGSSGSNVNWQVSGGIFSIGSGGTTGSISGNIANSATVTFNRSNSLTYSDEISGSGQLRKEGAGQLTLTSAQSYTGATTVAGGTLLYGTANAVATGSAVTVQSGATLDLAGYSSTIGSLAGAGTLSLNTASITLGGDGNSTIFTGSITGTGGGTLTKTGGGIFSASGTMNIGALAVNQGTVTLNASERISDWAEVSVASGASLNLNSNSETVARLSGGGGIALGSGTLTLNQNTGSSFSGGISGSGGSLVKGGTGTLTLSGSNTFTGPTVVNGGTLRLGADHVLSNSTRVSIAAGLFDVDGRSDTIGNLEGAGVVSLGLDPFVPGSLTFGDSTSTTFSGSIAGIGSLNKNGVGTFSLSGSAASSVTVNVFNGTFEIGNGGTSGSTAGAVNNFGATVSFNRSDDFTHSAIIGGTGGTFRKDGAGVMTLAAQQTSSGSVQVANGTLLYGIDNALSDSAAVNVFSTGTLDLASRTDTIGSLTGSGTVNTGNFGELTFGGNGDSTLFGGTIRGSADAPLGGTLNKTGGGTFTIYGEVNARQVNLQQGRITVASNEGLNARMNLAFGSQLRIGAGLTNTLHRLEGAGDVQLEDDASLIVSDFLSYGEPEEIYFDGDLFAVNPNNDGTTFTKTGYNNLTSRGILRVFGPAYVNQGTLRLAPTNSTSDQLSAADFVQIASGATLHIDTASRSFQRIVGHGTVRIDNNEMALNGNGTAFGGTVTGDGLVRLTSVNNVLDGRIDGSESTLLLQSGDLDVSSTGYVNSSSIRLEIDQTNGSSLLRVTGDERLSDAAHVQLNGTATTLQLVNPGQVEMINSLSGTGLVDFAGSSGRARLHASSSGAGVFEGAMTGNGGLVVDRVGLFGWGGTRVSDHTGVNEIHGQSTLYLASDERLPVDGTLVFGSNSWSGPEDNGVFDLNGFDQTLGFLSVPGHGTVIVPETSRLTVREVAHQPGGISVRGGVVSGGGRISIEDLPDANPGFSDLSDFSISAESSFTGSLHVNRGEVRSSTIGRTGGSLFTTHVAPLSPQAALTELRPLLMLDTYGDMVHTLAGGAALNVSGGMVGSWEVDRPLDSDNLFGAAAFLPSLRIDGTEGAGVLRVDAYGGDVTSSVWLNTLRMFGDEGLASVRGGQLFASQILLSGTGGSLLDVAGGLGKVKTSYLSTGGANRLHASQGGLVEAHRLDVTGDGVTENVVFDRGSTLSAMGDFAEFISLGQGGVMRVTESTISRGAGLGYALTTQAGSKLHLQRSTADFGSLSSRGGQIIVEDSIVNFGTLGLDSTSPGIDFHSGTITFESGIGIGSQGPFGSSLDLAHLRHLDLGTNNLTITSGGHLTLSGGSLTAADLLNQGGFTFNQGLLRLTGSQGLQIGNSGLLGPVFTLGTGAAIDLTGGGLAVTGTSTMTVAGGIIDAVSGNVGGTLRVSDGLARLGAGGLDVQSAGRVFTEGLIDVEGASTNQGRITLQSGTGWIGGGTLTNSGILTGDGEVAALVVNQTAGEVRGESGRTLLLSHADGLTNSGKITLQGGTVEVHGELANTGSGALISGRGTLIAAGGIENSRSMAFSSGITDIYGDVNNVTGGRIVTSGGVAAVTTFFDDVVHNGTEIRTSGGSSTIFMGELSGSGPFTGTGTVFVEGDMRPGNSPGLMTFEGNLVLGPASRLFFELDDTDRGAGYDAIDVFGDFTMGGILDVVFGADFTAAIGSVFDLFDWENVSGMFSAINLPDLTDGWSWDLSRFETDGAIAIAMQAMTYEQWRLEHPFVDEAEGDPSSDADDDGRVNLLEYVLGSDPLIADAGHPHSPRPHVVEVDDEMYLALSYTRPAGIQLRSDTMEVVTYSSDLAASSWNTAAVLLHAQSDDGSHETLTYRTTTPIHAGSRGFLRLEADLVE